jgi:hypothetical protein
MSIALPTERSTPKAGLLDKKTLLYGRPKVGKSTIANELSSKPLFIATEPGLSAISAYEAPVRTWTDFLHVAGQLAKGEHDYDLLIIDTVDELARLCAEHVVAGLAASDNLNTERFIHASDFDYGRGWDAIATEFRTKVAKFCNLGVGVVFISHAKEGKVKSRTGLEIDTFAPDVGQKGMRKWLLGFVDYIFFATIVTDGEGAEHRVLQCQPSAGIEAGARMPQNGPELPQYVPLSAEHLRDVLSPPTQNGTSGKAKEKATA